MRDAEQARATACGIASLVAPSPGLTRCSGWWSRRSTGA